MQLAIEIEITIIIAKTNDAIILSFFSSFIGGRVLLAWEIRITGSES